MHSELIGQEASLSLPCSVDATALLLGFIEELMEVSGSETEESLEGDIQAAVSALCHEHGHPGGQVLVTFAIHDDSVEVRLEGAGVSASADEDREIVVAREA